MSEPKRWADPFDDMSDEELDKHVEALFSKKRQSVGVSMRIPEDLLERLKREASRAGMPYQTFMKALLDAAVSRLERRPAPAKARSRRSA